MRQMRNTSPFDAPPREAVGVHFVCVMTSALKAPPREVVRVVLSTSRFSTLGFKQQEFRDGGPGEFE